MAELLRFASAAIIGGVVYSAALGNVPVALGLLAFFIMLTAAWSESRFERLMTAINELRMRS
ncbi:hypothetical protein NIM87_04320 [Devosia sp. XJ19-1]|uniref:Uncharacterized protein n=1 Tax=Devosia ureilytica TaxID=2952754 RepID=A0A9Q4AMK9_9HYPH|nr:hypothetical protein [Devosia ureilytica]MCP8882714.1 hypothetical protein [Devosia ureilytica]MCP8886918.1 hypothetical protein [Devosia ureilytica]